VPADHPDLATGLWELARMTAHRDPRAAIPLYDEAMRIHVALPDRVASEDRTILAELGALGLRAGRSDWALGWFERLPAGVGENQALRHRLLRARRAGR
jgi:hypothetical protein